MNNKEIFKNLFKDKYREDEDIELFHEFLYHISCKDNLDNSVTQNFQIFIKKLPLFKLKDCILYMKCTYNDHPDLSIKYALVRMMNEYDRRKSIIEGDIHNMKFVDNSTYDVYGDKETIYASKNNPEWDKEKNTKKFR
jgi:hypothetical protein